MEKTNNAEKLWERMARIDRMERGTLCQMKGRNHFNHPTWQAGRNVVRYVPRDQVEALKEDIQSYEQFMDWVRQYADEIIRISRRQREANSKHPKNKRNNPRSGKLN